MRALLTKQAFSAQLAEQPRSNALPTAAHRSHRLRRRRRLHLRRHHHLRRHRHRGRRSRRRLLRRRRSHRHRLLRHYRVALAVGTPVPWAPNALDAARSSQPQTRGRKDRSRPRPRHPTKRRTRTRQAFAVAAGGSVALAARAPHAEAQSSPLTDRSSSSLVSGVRQKRSRPWRSSNDARLLRGTRLTS